MAFFNRLLVLLLICQHICYVMAAECTTAIVASVFGTIGGLLVIAAIVALVWHCCKRRESTALSSTSSADTASDPEFSFGTKTKSGNIGLNGSGTPVTFSHRYSEKAPSAAYNTSGVVNPAFAESREVLIDMPYGHHDEVKIDLDGDHTSFKSPAHNGEVKIDMDGGSGIEPSLGTEGVKFPSGTDDVKLDMDWDHEHSVNFPDVDLPELELPEASDRSAGSRLPGTDANVVVKGPSTSKFGQTIPSVDLPKDLVDVFLERPGNGGFGLLIARDKTLPPPALFIREVTPGGIAAKTGLVDKGDKIIAINDTSIEGLPHDQAMSLLRDDNQKIMHLTLLKKELYKIKGRSIDRPDGSIEESCNVDISPELEAGVPSLDGEGVQRSSPDGVTTDISGRKPEFSMGTPHLDMPEGRLKTHVSGPDAFTDVDLGKPSAGLDLPSPKKKSTRCFSCASRGHRDEPYMKGKSNVDMDLSTPDMKAKAKAPDIHFSSGKPDDKRLFRDFEGPDGPMEMKAGSNFDISGSGVSVGDVQNKYGLHGSSPDVELDVDKERYSGDVSLPSLGVPAKVIDNPDLELTSKDFDGPTGQMDIKTGSNFDICGSGPSARGPDVGDTQKKCGLHASSPDVELDLDKERYSGDVSSPSLGVPAKVVDKPDLELTSKDLSGPAAPIEMKAGCDFDVSGSGPGIEGPDLGNTQKKYGLRASVPDVDVDVDKERPSGGVSLTSSGVAAEVPRPGSSSVDINLPSRKKKLGTCLTCTGSGKKDEPYLKARKNYGYEFDGKHVDGSIEMDKLSGPSIEASGPDIDTSKKRPRAGLNFSDQNISAPEGRMSTEMSGSEAKLTTGRVKGHREGIDMPSSKFRAASPDFNVQGPNKGTFPEIPKMSVGTGHPNIKSPEVFTQSGSIPGVSGSEGDLSGPTADVSIADVKITGPKGSFSGPEFEAFGAKRGASGPEFRGSGPDTDFSGPNVNVGGLRADVSAEQPNVDITGKPKVSGPNLDVSTGNIKDSKVNLGHTTAELDLPSRKKAKGGNCFSCTGGADKDESYQMKTGTVNVDLDGGRRKQDLKLRSIAPDIESSKVGRDVNTSLPNTSLPSAGVGGETHRDVRGPRVGAGFDVNAPDQETPKGNLQADISEPDVKVSTEDVKGPQANLHGLSSYDGLPSKKKGRGTCVSCASNADKDEPYGGPTGKGEFKLEQPDVDGTLAVKKTGNFDLHESNADGKARNVKINDPDFNLLSNRLNSGFHRPEIDVKAGEQSDIDIAGPDFSLEKPKVSDNFPDVGDKDFEFAGPDLDSDRPGVDVKASDQHEIDIAGPDFSLEKSKVSSLFAGVGDEDFWFAGPDLDDGRPGIDVKAGDQREIDIVGPDLSLEKPKVSGNFAGVEDKDFGFESPDLDSHRPRIDVKASDQREIDITGPDFSLEKTKVSGLVAGAGDEDFGLVGPDLDTERPQGSTDRRFSGPNSLDSPRVRDLDTDTNIPDLGISGSKPSFELGRKTVDTDTSEIPAGDLHFDVSKSDFDTKIDPPDPDISTQKTQFGLKFGMDKPKPKIPTSDFNLDGSFPEIGLNTNMATDEKLDIDVDRPGIKGFGIDIPQSDIAVSDPNLDGSLPEADASVKRPRIGIGDGELDLDASKPKQDISVPTTQFGGKGYVIHTPEPKGDLSFQPRGKDYDASSDWKVNTSTPKRKGDTLGGKKLETEPLVAANKDNLEVQSSPTQFPSMTCEEPRNLQRYDEIHPDMELRLLSPTKTDHSDPSFDFETPDKSLDMGNDGLERRPGRMSLVKVEENVTIFSASLDEDELPSPRNRTLTLDREIKQKIEVVFPAEEGSDTKQKSSTSSSSSSSSDTDDNNKEKKEKRNKKSRLLKAFRKGSTSSTSSKDRETSSKRKGKERKSSRSSSTSEDDKEGKKKQSKGDAFSVEKTGHIKPKKRKSSDSSSSADNKTGKEGSVKEKEPKQRKMSTSSTSSSNNDDYKTNTLPKRSEEASEPVKYNVEYTTIPKQYLSSADMEGPETPHQVASVPAVVTQIQGDKPKYEERKSSTSSSSDESTRKQKVSPKDLQPSMLYQVEYFTNQQNYIIEPHNELDKPELSAAEVQEDAPKVEFHSVKPEDPKFSFIRSKERKGSASSSSSDERGADDQEVAFQVQTPSVEPKDPALFFNKSKERKSSTSSSSSEDSGRLSPNLDVSVHRYETVHHVPTPDHPLKDQPDVTKVNEEPLVVVTRSFKRPVLESDEKSEQEHSSIQFTQPPVDLDYHLQYPYIIRTDIEDNDEHIQEEGITPVVSSTSVEYEVPDLSVLLQPDSSHSEDEDKAKQWIQANEDDRLSPTIDMQAHSFDTVYEVKIPEKPVTDEDGLEIQERSPVVVMRSIKWISTGNDDLEGDDQLFANKEDIQLSEPSNDFQLDYPEGGDVFTTEYLLPKTEEEWIVKHSMQKEKPDIAALAGSLDSPEKNDLQKVEDKSPREESLPRRNSNSRLWELMQGYLIERPIVDDDETKQDPEKTTEVKSEEESKSNNVERTVYNITYQPAPIKFDTVNVHVQASENKELVTEMNTSSTKVESFVPKVTPSASQYNMVAVQPDITEQHTAPMTASVPKAERVVPKVTSNVSQFNIFTVQPGFKEQYTAHVTAPVPKVESVVPKVTSSVSQFEPVAIQLDVSGKKPVTKEPSSSWKKQASHRSDTDDDESDPWMRHYSKGLYQRGHHQPSTTKFTEKESTVPQSYGISLSKVPHVKGVRKSSKQHERPRYSIEGLARIEPVSYPGSTDRGQTQTSRQEPSSRLSVSSLRSLWDK